MKFHLSNSVQLGDKPSLFCLLFSLEHPFGLLLPSMPLFHFRKRVAACS